MNVRNFRQVKAASKMGTQSRAHLTDLTYNFKYTAEKETVAGVDSSSCKTDRLLGHSNRKHAMYSEIGTGDFRQQIRNRRQTIWQDVHWVSLSEMRVKCCKRS